MKLLELLLSASLIFLSGECTTKNPVNTNQTKGLVGLSMLLHQNSTAGLAGYLESINDVTSKGINLFGMAPEWSEIEPTPGTYLFQNPITNPLTLTDPGKTKFKNYILVLKMIDSHRKTVPSDLSTLSFDNPLVIGRFNSLIDSLSKTTSIDRVSHILLGNEVDGYLSTHLSELNAFSLFYQQVVTHIHSKMPLKKVGTIITFNSVSNNPTIFNTLAPSSDFICYTYYPTDNSSTNWQMRPPADFKTDILFMAQKAGNKPFAFTEIGYPSSSMNNSSEILQSQFVENMFDALRIYKNEAKLEFIFYHGLYDYPPGFCSTYANSQGIDSAYLCGFMNNLGLKNYTTGQPKQSWNSFINKLVNW